MSTPLKVFCCYAREDQEMLARLKTHLMPLQRDGQITIWSDTNINAGVEWEKELHHHLRNAHLILLLISPDFMNSDYCYSTEMELAIERHNQGSARVIPILLRPTIWQNAPFAKIQIVPKDARPVTNWSNIDDAFYNVAESIKQVVSSHMLIKADRYDGMAELAPPFPANVGIQIIQRRHGLTRITVILLAGLAFLVVMGGGIGVLIINQQPPYPPFGTLVLTDALSDNSQGHVWDDFAATSNFLGGTCQFKERAYDVSVKVAGGGNACLAQKSNFRNFAFEVQMTIMEGDCGGIVFRVQQTNNGTFYHFQVCQDGTYTLWTSFSKHLIYDDSSAEIHRGLNHSNLIAVIANNHTLELYVNNQKINSRSDDSTYSQGKIGVEASSKTRSTEVVFRNARVWT
jgi:TIR domain/Domain of Unknown Function (DUF1080)